MNILDQLEFLMSDEPYSDTNIQKRDRMNEKEAEVETYQLEDTPEITGEAIPTEPFDPLGNDTMQVANTYGGENTVDMNVDTEQVLDKRSLAINEVKSKLLENEGASGDTTTGAPITYKTGMTKDTKELIEKKLGRGISDDEAIELYLEEAYNKLSNMKGFDKASVELQSALVDSYYNLGDITNYSKLKRNLRNVGKGYTEADVVKDGLLDTANKGGKSLRGIAIRRAKLYNKVAEDPIVNVDQRGDGTIKYLDSNNKIVFSYKAKNGMHPDSKVGIIPVQ